MNVSGNTVFITGGTSGIGLGFAERFLELGSKVIICGRRKERLDNLKLKHPELITKICDISSDEERKSIASWLIQNHPDTNVLINNAGIQLAVNLTEEVDLTNLRREVETNLIAPVHLTSLLVNNFAAKEEAAVINITSGLAFVPLAAVPVYCGVKAALHSITLSQRYQLRDTNVKVFEIIPPSVDTELGHERREDKSKSHGGMSIKDFIDESMEALSGDVFEAAIADAKNLRDKREAAFPFMNR